MHEIETMDLEETTDLYASLPAPKCAAEIAIIRAVGDRAHALRTVARAGEVKPKLLFTTPKPEGEQAAPVITKRPKWKTAPEPAEAETGGALFFMQGLKR
jgi:hypothetical protein